MKKLIVVLVGLTVLATACGTKVADVSTAAVCHQQKILCSSADERTKTVCQALCRYHLFSSSTRSQWILSQCQKTKNSACFCFSAVFF